MHKLNDGCIQAELLRAHLRPHFQFHYLDFVCDDRRLVALVKSRIEEFDGVGMKLVRKPRPFELERHPVVMKDNESLALVEA